MYKREKKRRIRERERKKETYEREDLTSGVHFVEHMLCCVLTCHSSTRHQPKVFSNFLTSPERRFFGGGGFKYQNERQPVISLWVSMTVVVGSRYHRSTSGRRGRQGRRERSGPPCRYLAGDWSSISFFINGPSSASLSLIFRRFKPTVHILWQLNVKKCTSSIQCWDSNSRPLGHQFS